MDGHVPRGTTRQGPRVLADRGAVEIARELPPSSTQNPARRGLGVSARDQGALFIRIIAWGSWERIPCDSQSPVWCRAGQAFAPSNRSGPALVRRRGRARPERGRGMAGRLPPTRGILPAVTASLDAGSLHLKMFVPCIDMRTPARARPDDCRTGAFVCMHIRRDTARLQARRTHYGQPLGFSDGGRPHTPSGASVRSPTLSSTPPLSFTFTEDVIEMPAGLLRVREM